MPYRPDHPALAVIDIGSNSVRMVIYDLAHNPPTKIFNEKLFCALGRDLSHTGCLNPDGVESALKALTAYSLICEVQQIKDVVTVGTAALRDAKDAHEFIAAAKQRSGLDIQVISGDREAAYAARGVLMFDKNADGIVADFGGGSLEFARIGQNDVHDTISLPMGAYRVMAMQEDADEKIAELLAPLQGRFGQAQEFYAIGGSWRSLAVAYEQDHGQTGPISTPGMIEFCRKVESMAPSDIQTGYRMEQHRASLAPISAYTLRQVLTHLQPVRFSASAAGVRDGVVHEFLFSITETR